MKGTKAGLRPKPFRGYSKESKALYTTQTVLAVLVTLVMLFPLYWMIISSLRPGEVLLGKVFHNFALKLLSAVIGAIIYYAVIQIVLRLGLDTNDLKLLTALVVAVFLSIPFWKSQYFTKAVRKGGTSHA